MSDLVRGHRGTFVRFTRANFALSRAAFRSLVAYQSSFLFGLLASAVAALAMLYLWRAVIAGGTLQGFDWQDMKAYLLVSFVTSSFVSTYVDYRMAGRIRDGNVALDLVRPIGFQRARFAEALGFGAYEAVTAIAVAAVAALIFGGIRAPDSGLTALFVVSILLVLPLRFGVVYISCLVVFWTQNYIGVQSARIALVTLLSGGLVPLAFFPAWLRNVTPFLPFPGMASTPALIYVGRLSGTAAVIAVLVQAAWAIGLWILGAAMWRFASKQFTVHGG